MKKIVEPTGDLCVKFTDEELTQLGIKAGDKFSIKETDEGIVLQKFATIELDLEIFTKEQLIMFIQLSVEKDMTFEEVIEELLTKAVDSLAQQ